MKATKILNIEHVRAGLAEFAGLILFEYSNDSVEPGDWYATETERHFVRAWDWKPDEDLNQMALVEAKIMANPVMAVRYGVEIEPFRMERLNTGRAKLNDPAFMALAKEFEPEVVALYLVHATVATLSAKDRAMAAWKVISHE